MRISVAGIGAWAMGEWKWGSQEDADSIAGIHAALDAGANWIDTAPIYGNGHSEEVVGKALAELPANDRPYVFSKFGLGADSENMNRSASYDEVMSECENSLRRLQVDCIDMYQLHWPVEQEMEETARACEQLMKDGKIRYIGVSNYSTEQLDQWQATGSALHLLQTPLSVLNPETAESQIPWCFKHEVACIAYSPLYRGMLFGTWSADKCFPEGDGRAVHKDFTGDRFVTHLGAIQQIRDVAVEYDLDCAQLCIGMLLCNPGLTACIIGVRNAGQGAYVGELCIPAKSKAIEEVDVILEKLQVDLSALG
ncbi:MAG: aldo/keto reductase [Planctomycetes bacterium]|nr:aldo/keto reductase [Planctomycetota bacterium]